ncbi:MAG: hypothetical protein GY870_17280 [archaeon]|nr:hypothetical protein [archaeon]
MKNKNEKKLKNDYLEILNPTEYSKLLNIDLESSKDFILSARKKKERMVNEIYYKNAKIIDKNTHTISIPLNSKNFNKILDNGFCSKKIYLLYGEFATGKSQICHNLCVSTYKIYKDLKKSSKSIFIDTENTFRPKRIIEIAENDDLDSKKILPLIQVYNANNTEKILMILIKFETEGLDKSIKLLIIDSLTNYIRVELGNNKKSNLKVRENLIKIMEKLRILKEKYNLLVIITSQVKSLPANISGFTIRPILEYIINEYIDESILLSRSEEEIRFAFLINSCYLPENNIEFKIALEGIIDPR